MAIVSLPNSAATNLRQLANAPTTAPSGSVEFTINPQDKTVMSASIITLNGVKADVSTDKVALVGGMKPNADGKYVYDESDSKNFTAAIAFSAVAHVVDLTQQTWGEKITWATGREKLTVTPDAGEDFNAYYSRQKGGTFYFHGTDPVTKEVIYSGRSGEVTGHEGGHAILDAKRPNYLGGWAPDPGAFHESFGDCLALAVALQDPRTIELVAQQTGGDLSKQNSAAALGEELGVAINHKVGHDATGGPYTRNAINTFTWQDPNSLPNSAPPDQLSREVHSLSRLWTGAMYDITKTIVAENMAAGQDAKTALENGGKELHKMLGRLLKPGQAPDGSFKFKDMAKALVKSENELNGGKHSDLIKKVMDERKILANTPGFDQDTDVPIGTRELSVELKGSKFGIFEGARVATVLSGEGSRSFSEETAEREELSNDIARLIDNGDILMTEPNQDPSKLNLIKADGEPYRGVVRWVDMQPVIEPTYIAG
jgi:hypothetical protein